MNLMSLMEYAAHKDGTYVALNLSKESQDMLDHFVEMNLGLDHRVDPSTYHITVIYSRTPVPSAENYKHMNTTLPVVAHASEYEVFPTKSDGKCLVLRIECPYATRLNGELTKLGATSDYDTYKPHITVAYNITQEIEHKELPIPQFELVFDQIHVAPLDPHFIPANKE